MLKLRRLERRTEITHAEKSVVLIETNWVLVAGRNDKAAGISYQAPTGLESGEGRVRIWDHYMIIRLIAFALIAALTIGLRRRERQ